MLYKNGINVLAFAFGLSFGILCALFLTLKPTGEMKQFRNKPTNHRYEKWFEGRNLIRKEISPDELRYGNVTHKTEADYLRENIKVLCVILIKNPKNFLAGELTWMKGCNDVHKFNLTTENKALPKKRTKDSSSWALFCKGLIHFPQYQWYFFVYDNTFVIMENLRLILAGLNYNKGFYLGHAVTFWSVSYNSADAGYVLSKGAIEGLRKEFGSYEDCVSSSRLLNKEDFSLGLF